MDKQMDDYKDILAYNEMLQSENKALESMIESLKHLSINLIEYSQKIKSIQMKCLAEDYKDVKDVGIHIPTYQTFTLQKKMKQISKLGFEENKCAEAIKILMEDVEIKNG